MPARSTIFALYPVLLAGVFLAAATPMLPAQPAQAGKDALTIVDFGGKEHKITGWKFTTGTRHLNWLATDEAKKAAKKPADAGPEVLEFSEGKAPPLKNRVLSWIPVKHIRSIEYDHKKSTVTLNLAAKDGKDIVLHGLTGYIGVNHLSIDAEEDLKEFGKAEIKFLGGAQQGVKKITFSASVPLEALPKGRPAQVATSDKNNKAFTAVDLQPLYQLSNLTAQLEPTLHFQKTVKVELDKIQQFSHVGSGAPKGGLVFDVKLKSGTQKPLVLIEQRLVDKKLTETLIGLLGRVEAGYRLVPMAAIQQVNFDQAAEAAPAGKE